MGSEVGKLFACGTGESDSKSINDSYRPTESMNREARKENESPHYQQTSHRDANGYIGNADSERDHGKQFGTSMRLRDETDDLFGYHFNDEGRLCDAAGNSFGQKGAKTINEETFSKLTTKIMEFVQEKLVNVYCLEKITVPVNAAPDEPRSFIFATQNAHSTTGKLLILIHGSGNVVAGIWSKKVILYDNLYKGSQLPYVEQAIADGYEVVILNTNVNSKSTEVDSWKGRVPIRGSSNPIEHALYVWDNFILKSNAQHIAIVAHSYGGVVTTELAMRRKDSFLRKVFAVAFTDSVHRLDQKIPQEVVKFFCDNARNWVTSDKVLDTPVDKNKKQPQCDAPRVSAGDLRHEWTSHAAFRSVFAFVDQKLRPRFSESQKQIAAVGDPKTRTNL